MDASLSTRGTELRVERVVVTNEQVLGKRIGDLGLKQKYDVVVVITSYSIHYTKLYELIRLLYRIQVEREAQAFEQQPGQVKENLYTMNVAVRNPNLTGLSLAEIPNLEDGTLVCSRLKRGRNNFV